MDSFLSALKMPLALAATLLLAWISMHLLLYCLGLSITADEIEGRAPQAYLAGLDRALGLALLAAFALQILIAWTLMHAFWKAVRRSHPIMLFGVGFVLGVACTALLVFFSLSTGGALVEPSLEHALKSLEKISW